MQITAGLLRCSQCAQWHVHPTAEARCPAWGCPWSTFNTSARNFSMSLPIKMLVSISTVTGFSVFGRTGQAGNPQISGLLLNPAGVGDDHRGPPLRGEEFQVRHGCRGTDHRQIFAEGEYRAQNLFSISQSSTFAGRWRVTSAYWRGVPFFLACLATGRSRIRVSIITFPTRWIFPGAIPSRCRFISQSAEGVKRSWESWSVTARLISSGMLRSKDRKPASTCPIGTRNLAQTKAAATVEFHSFRNRRTGWAEVSPQLPSSGSWCCISDIGRLHFTAIANPAPGPCDSPFVAAAYHQAAAGQISAALTDGSPYLAARIAGVFVLHSY